ncbi:MAG: GxxExxY protein [Chloroflexi bacterium]|nr:GxxExxY protein [Chloroflexota bacterium]
MRGNSVVTPQDPVTFKIIGCAMAAHRKLGPGLREDAYQRDLEARSGEAGLGYAAQKLLEVYDDNAGHVLLGYYIPDFMVAEQVIVEIKALHGLDNGHVAQIIGYLAVTGYPVGLLINFGARSLQWRRVFPPKNIKEHQVNRQWLFVPDWLKESK